MNRYSVSAHISKPRNRFDRTFPVNFTLKSGLLRPFLYEEVMPGDTFVVNSNLFARLATPLFPIMDDIFLDIFYFLVPKRIVWSNWVKFWGERKNPDDSIDYLIPTVTSPIGGYDHDTIFDALGVTPKVPNLTTDALRYRGYNLIWNEWFRDENLQDSVPVNDESDGPDDITNYILLPRGKRHDYFTSCLPWPQKGLPISLPTLGEAPVKGIGFGNYYDGDSPITVRDSTSVDSNDLVSYPDSRYPRDTLSDGSIKGGNVVFEIRSDTSGNNAIPNLRVDLSTATALTVNNLRQAEALQSLAELDARGGTRYSEINYSYYGVVSPDGRLHRPEYLGGGSMYVNVHPVVQTSSSQYGGAQGTPQGTLSAFATASSGDNGFTRSFTEHGFIIGLLSVRTQQSYQYAMQRSHFYRTKYDFHIPAFNNLGEQAIKQREIFPTGDPVEDDKVFGYLPRFDEWRLTFGTVSGAFRSNHPESLDPWLLTQEWTNAPTLSSEFIVENPPMNRVLAVPSDTHFIVDGRVHCQAFRPLSLYSIPGIGVRL